MEILGGSIVYLIVCLLLGPLAWLWAGRFSWMAVEWDMPSKMYWADELLVRNAGRWQLLYWLLAPLSFVVMAIALMVIIIRALAVIGMYIAGKKE